MVRKAVFLIILLLSSRAYAEDINFYSDVSPRAGTMDETFILSVVIENAQNPGTPYLIGGDDFEVRLLGPRQSTSIVNGVVSTEIAFNYQLTAKKEGVLSSPAAEVEIEDKKYTAPAIQVKVSKSANPDKHNAANGIVLQQNIGAPRVFLGEQLRYTLSLYAAVPVYDYSFSDEPLDGFWGQNIGDVDKSLSTLDDRRYNLFRWHKALYPVKTGSLTIPPRKLTAQVQTKARARSFPFGYNDPFSDPFESIFGAAQIEKREYKTNPLTVEVLPLPPKPDRIESWGLSNILVGETSIEAEGDLAPIKTGESKTITVTVRSLGNLNPYNKLPLEDSEDFRIYQDNAIEKHNLDDEELRMSKTFKVSIIPLKPGTFSLPRLRLSYFDARTAQYKLAESADITFDVTGQDLRSKDRLIDTPQNVSEPEVKKDTQIIKYEEDSFLKRVSSQLSPSLALFAVAALLFIAYILALLFRHSKSNSSRLSGLKRISGATDAPSLSRALQELLQEKLSIPPEGSYGDQLRANLEKKISDQDLRYRLQSVMDKLDAAQYGGTVSPGHNVNDLKSELRQIIPLL